MAPSLITSFEFFLMKSLKTSLLASTLVFLALTGSALADAVKGEKPAHVSYGQKVELSDLAVKGKTTVFDFTSKYCPPCQAIAPKLDELHQRRADIAVVKVDINRPDVKGIDWKSPVAQQYALKSIPHFKIYGPDGKLLAEGQDARKMVTDWLE